MEQQPRILVPHDEAVTALGGIGRTTLYELIATGHLTKVNIGRRSFVTAKSIDTYVDSLTAAAVQ
jgi:predicted DNA-binding transcriptional regulator AlpA